MPGIAWEFRGLKQIIVLPLLRDIQKICVSPSSLLSLYQKTGAFMWLFFVVKSWVKGQD